MAGRGIFWYVCFCFPPPPFRGAGVGKVSVLPVTSPVRGSEEGSCWETLVLLVGRRPLGWGALSPKMELLLDSALEKGRVTTVSFDVWLDSTMTVLLVGCEVTLCLDSVEKWVVCCSGDEAAGGASSEPLSGVVEAVESLDGTALMGFCLSIIWWFSSPWLFLRCFLLAAPGSRMEKYAAVLARALFADFSEVLLIEP